MRNLHISFAIVLAVISISAFNNNANAQVSCPVGYTCTPVDQVPSCPAGYICKPTNTSTTDPVTAPTTNGYYYGGGYSGGSSGSVTPSYSNDTVIQNTSCFAFSRDLTLGSSGSDVVALQTWLINNGYDIAAVSSGRQTKGYFSYQTAAAVARYQASIGTYSTGYFGPLTRAKLNALCGGNTTYVPPTNPTPTQPTMCTAIYQPVCGTNGQTYSNSCVARNAGVTNYTDGACSTYTNQGLISITSPANGTSWKRNTEGKWSWTTTGSIPTVDLYLITSLGQALPFATNYPNNGSFWWAVGYQSGNWYQDVPNGNYTIAVCPYGVGYEKDSYGDKRCGKFTINIYGDTPVIQMTAPMGGQTFQAGGSIPVSFSGVKYSEQYKVTLHLIGKEGSPIYDLGTVTGTSADQMKNTFTIPSGAVAGTYTVVVIQTTNQGPCINACAKAESSQFTITSSSVTTCPSGYICGNTPSITVLSPNGGESFAVSQPIKISFTTSQPNQRVYINLDSPAGGSYDLISYNNYYHQQNIPDPYYVTNAGNQSVSLYVPDSWVATRGTQYKFEICTTGIGNCDKSDNYFTITSSQPQACTADAKQCPDGSYVGRDGANACQFKACPVTSAQPLTVSCYGALKDSGLTIGWGAQVSGGKSPYTYSWSAYNDVSTYVGGSTASNAFTANYSTTGTKQAVVRVTDAVGNSTSATCSATLYSNTIPVPPTPTVSFSASPTSINAGGMSTLYWSTTNANRCVMQYGSSEENISTNGSKVVYPSQTTSYKIWCVNDPNNGKDGPATDRTITVTVNNTSTPTSAPLATISRDSGSPMTQTVPSSNGQYLALPVLVFDVNAQGDELHLSKVRVTFYTSGTGSITGAYLYQGSTQVASAYVSGGVADFYMANGTAGAAIARNVTIPFTVKADVSGVTSGSMNITASVGGGSTTSILNTQNNAASISGGAYSNTITVQSTASTPPPSVSTVTVTYPNGGETWVQGDQKRITWNGPSSLALPYTQIGLYGPNGSGDFVGWIYGGSWVSGGAYSWDANQVCSGFNNGVGTNCSKPNPGSYRVVVSLGDGSMRDLSDSTFSITAALSQANLTSSIWAAVQEYLNSQPASSPWRTSAI